MFPYLLGKFENERDFFLVEEAIEGGYTARAIGESIFTEGEDMDDLKTNIKEAVICHFGKARRVSLSLSKGKQ